ncbi:MAG: SET domain-containing protein [Alphaproteobacteria bacterium]
MLLVRTYVGPSRIHGLGVYAAEPIAKGTQMWRFEPTLDRIIPFADFDRLPEASQEFLRIYCYLWPEFGDGWILNGDHARFINHSRAPNTDNSGPISLAIKDIAIDEEITCDYRECCLDHQEFE